MTPAQKVIKYFAIAFAIFIIITIISAILGTFYALSGLLGLKRNETSGGEMTTTEIQNNDVQTLDIELAYTSLTIKTGDSFKIETNNDKVKYTQNNQKLEIKEKNSNWFSNNKSKEVVIYVPENLEFKKVEIDTGAGKISIENLKTENLSFELGAGETEINNLNVTKKCDIEGGAGKVAILNGTINNLDLDMGVGEVGLTAMLTGKSDINAGVGALNLELTGNQETYKIRANKGIGAIRVDEKEMSDGEIYGDGENYIEVDGGIGNITISYAPLMEQ